MIKILIAALAVLALTACGSTTTTNTVTKVEMGDNGTYINNQDGTVTYTQTVTDGDATDGTTGDFDATDDATECRAKGYFYCPITQTCNDTSASTGSCTGRR